ncbi:hypothetical protein [Lacibacter sp.]|uniref:hypothetical protein n=1 Tax=Lacibacter sp. TaxID=1915409 RepID=UPI002B4AEA10|nr:hypothetical protein [Lacibacter sp.]HLP39182.1 hypothetical protein [Lacibacter sp.]
MIIGIRVASIYKVLPTVIGFDEKYNEDYYVQVDQYYFMLGVPWFPTQRKVVLRQKKGGKFEIPNTPELQEKVAELNSKIKTPIWCFAGPILGTIALLVVIANFAFDLDLMN